MDISSSRYRWIILVVGCFFHFTFTAAWIFVPIIETEFAGELVLDPFQVSLIYSAPLLAFVIFVFIGGIITDKLGVRNATMLSGILITSFGMLRGLSGGFLFLLITSFIFGIGGGLLYPNLGKIVADWFEDKKKGTATGIYLMAGGLGQVFSLSITAAILLPLFQNNWRLCFVFYGFFCLIITILGIFTLKTKEATNNSQQKSFSLGKMKQILGNKYIIGLCVIIFFGFSVFMGLTNYMGDLLADKGLGDPVYVYLASILSLGLTIGNVTLPLLSDIVKKRRIFLICCSSIAFCLLILIQLINIGEFLWVLIFFLGLMQGTLIPLCLTVSIEIKTLPEELAGSVSGLLLTFGFLGNLTVTLIFGVILSYSTVFFFCLLYLICLGIASFIVSLFQEK
ncbi:MAG TPA: MFS transporter [Candidatus Deferrimicrobium sp.]|nr:MFS transporter [Candidatus Deferrimicrobium sp.]